MMNLHVLNVITLMETTLVLAVLVIREMDEHAICLVIAIIIIIIV